MDRTLEDFIQSVTQQQQKKEPSLEDFYKSVGYKDGVLPRAPESKTVRSVPTSFYTPEGTQKLLDDDVDDEEKLKVDDLYNYENLNVIRNYMIRAKGVDYREADKEKLVDDWMDHMRWMNTNTVSTAGAVMFVSRGDEYDKQAAGEAFKLYDKLGNVFVNDGVYGAVTGVKDYVFAAASDPTNWVGLLTGGMAKGAALGVTQTGKAAMKKAASQAALRASQSGATRQAASAAAKEAAEAMARKMVQYSATEAATQKAVNSAARAARAQILLEAGQKAAKDVATKRLVTAGKVSLAGTAAFDSIAAATQDYALQNLYIDVGAQEEYSKMQTAFSSMLGGIATGAQLAGGAFQGASGLAQPIQDMKVAARAGKYKAEAPVLNPEAQKAATKVIREAYDSWTAKVSRGAKTLGEVAIPETLLKEIMLGTDNKGGLVKVFRDNGMKIRRTTTVSDLMTNAVRYMPIEDLTAVSQSIYKATGLHLGDMDTLNVALGDILARDISRAGGTLSVMSQVRKELDKGVVVGQDILANALEEKEVRDALGEGMKAAKSAKPFSYAQNVWKRLLVSSPATTAANVSGFAQFMGGQTVADLLNAGMLGFAGAVTGAGLTKTSRELFRMSKVYSTIQTQKMRNLLDPYTTHDAYMEFLDQHKDVKSLLFETVGAGVERSAKRYNINPNNPVFNNVEKFTTAATQITGVRVQDSFTKSQMFMTEMDKYLRLSKKTSLKEVLQKGNLEVIDDNVIGAALDTTMRSVFSKDYTTDDQMLKGVAKLVENISNTPGLGTILPFGRFMNNVVATAYQWGPVSLIPATAKLMKNRNVTAMEAFSRSLVGTTSLRLAMEFSEEQEKKGLAYNEVDVGGGTIVDVQNMFPFSFFLAAGRYANLIRKGEAVPKEAKEDMLAQLAIGQVARDMQFANDLYNVMDVFTSDSTRGANLDALYKSLGNVAAGATRPLDFVNRLVGFMTETDYAKDVRQAETGGKILTQSATKYFDNIIEALTGEVDSITGERLRLATRPGDIYDANPLARVFGLTVKRGRTASEKAYSMANMKTWTADSRTKMPAYDRIFNESIAPILEGKMSQLLSDKRFTEGDLAYKRDRLRDALKDAKGVITEGLEASSGEPFMYRMRYLASQRGTKEQREKAMKFMREQGVAADISDFNFREVSMYTAYIDHLRYIAEGN